MGLRFNVYSKSGRWCCALPTSIVSACVELSVLFFVYIVVVFGWVTFFNNKASFRGLFGFAKLFRIYCGESGAVGILIILPCEFGFAIIVNVYVGNAFIAFGGRVSVTYI